MKKNDIYKNPKNEWTLHMGFVVVRESTVRGVRTCPGGFNFEFVMHFNFKNNFNFLPKSSKIHFKQSQNSKGKHNKQPNKNNIKSKIKSSEIPDVCR